MDALIVPAGPKRPCRGTPAILALSKFEQAATEWETSKAETISQTMTTKLEEIRSQSDCWRFYCKAWFVLLKAPDDFFHSDGYIYLEHMPYWNVLGEVAGKVLSVPLGGRKGDDRILYETLFIPWFNRFKNSNWITRSLIMNATNRISERAVLWNEPFGEALEYYLAYALVAVEAGQMNLPKGCKEGINWLCESYATLAVRYREERTELAKQDKLFSRSIKSRQNQKTFKRILNAALSIMWIVTYLFQHQRTSNETLDCWRNWRKILDYTINGYCPKTRESNEMWRNRIEHSYGRRTIKAANRFCLSYEKIYNELNQQQFLPKQVKTEIKKRYVSAKKILRFASMR